MKHLLAAARQCALRIPAEAAVCCAAAFLLTAVSTGGQYAPWALAAVAVAGVGWRGLAAVVCAGVGALAFLDFQPGLRHAAAAVLIFCANTAFCPSRLYRHPRFRPTAAVCAAALTQLPYLIARSGREWLLCGASLALLYGTVRLALASHAGARLPETAGAGAAAPAAAFQAVYDSLAAEMPLLRPENPAVLFDRAAEQVCRDCPLRADCWQSHYSDTYNAFNDACPVLLQRGRALAEDFPLYFACRCIRFPRLLEALDSQLRDYLQRRLHHARLDAAYRLAREQYRQVAQALTPASKTAPTRRSAITCRTASALRPKDGEKLCGDQCDAFDVGDSVYMALSDGMGSGEAAHREAAMTVRLLRQFLQAGIRPEPALQTLNAAAMLRCQSGAGFTTIDLVRLEKGAATLTLYKYGAAPSYLKRRGTVVRCQGSSLPAGLESADGQPSPQTYPVAPGTWLVQVSDGVAGDDDQWLQDLLAGWDGTSPRAMAQELLRQSWQRTGGADDCAVSVLAMDGREDARPV